MRNNNNDKRAEMNDYTGMSVDGFISLLLSFKLDECVWNNKRALSIRNDK